MASQLNKLAQFVQQNPLAVTQFGAGLLSQPTLGQGVQAGLLGAMQAKQWSDQREEKKKQQERFKELINMGGNVGPMKDLGGGVQSQDLGAPIQPGQANQYGITPQQAKFAEALGPVHGAQYLASLQAKQGGSGFTLSPGQTRFDANGNPIVGVAPPPKEPKEKDPFGSELKLRGEFDKQVADFRLLETGYQKIVDSARNPSAAGDISMIFAYMKMLDPTSVVREGEQATAANAGSVPQNVIKAYNRAISGERLHPAIRRDYVNRAGMLLEGQTNLFNETANRYTTLANEYDLNPSHVVSPRRQTAPLAIPNQGDIREGGKGKKYRFLGGDPNDSKNWELVK